MVFPADQRAFRTTPLIFLYKISGLEWVCRLADSQIVVPQAVIQEIAAGGGEAMMARIKNDPCFWVVANVPIPPVVAAWDLGTGETQVLSEALQSPKIMPRVNFPVIAYEFTANRSGSESLAASKGNQKRCH